MVSHSNFTPRFLEVLMNVLIAPFTSTPCWQKIPHRMLCRFENICSRKSWNPDYLPLSTLLFEPSSSLGVGTIFASRVVILLFKDIPSYLSEEKSLTSSTLCMNFSISRFFSWAGLIVDSEIFFLLNSSKLSGIPVITQNSGMKIVFEVSWLNNIIYILFLSAFLNFQ